MNHEHRFDLADTDFPPSFQSASELGHDGARARPQGAGAIAMLGRALRPLLGRVTLWRRQRATRNALMACSDRVLADIGIEREDIPLIACGIDPAKYQPRGSALQRRWETARARLNDLGQARRERRLLYRELDAYSNRELEEIGLRRADIPAIVRRELAYRRAA